MRSVRRLAAALAVALLGGAGSAVLGLPGPTAPAAAATTAPCVGVVVDGRLAGGALKTGCAAGDPGSGLEALTDAGFTYAFVPRQPGLVCQVDGLPECARTAADTYWSYWHRAKGSSRWVYSTEAAGTYDPEPGSTEAWVWQDGGRREPPDIAFTTVCPRATRAPSTPKPSPAGVTATPGTTTRARTATPAATSPAETSRATTPPAATTPAATTPTATTSTSEPSPTETAAASTAAPPLAGGTGPPQPRDDDGGLGPWIGLAVGAGAVALLGGAAVARYRRTPGSSP